MIKHKLSLLPENPGCYLMKDSAGKIIYVGKAKVLKNRVKQYFTGAHDLKTTRLVSEIKDFEYIITTSEKDALLLEINLIKQHRPKYNIALKDGKTYPYIKLEPNSNPILSIVRNQKSKKAYYYGPFPNVHDAKITIQLLNKIYGLYESKYLVEKHSTSYEFKSQNGNYRAQYKVNDAIIEKIKKFLRGDTKNIVSEIKQKMYAYSANMEYEKAQQQLSFLSAIEHVVEKNKVQLEDATDQDLINFYSEKGYMCVQVFLIRNGKLIERDFQVLDIYDDPETVFIQFLVEYYDSNTPPKQIIVPSIVDIQYIKHLINAKFIQPQKGEKFKMLGNVQDNARKQLSSHLNLLLKEEKIGVVWQALSEKLNIKLNKIEVFDNSHLASTHNVSGMIVIENGCFMKKQYRHYKLREYTSDYHSMKEVIYRRYFRLLMENQSFPDAIFVDGGIIQVNAAKAVLNDLQLSIPVYGLVKDDSHKSAALINEYNETIEIDKKDALFLYLANVQDEVHRYVINYHRNIRVKNMTKSFLDDIIGLGDKRRLKLLRHFKSTKNIKEATLEQLSKIVPLAVAQNIKKKVGEENNEKNS